MCSLERVALALLLPPLQPAANSDLVERPAFTQLHRARQLAARRHRLCRSNRYAKDRGDVLDVDAFAFDVVVCSLRYLQIILRNEMGRPHGAALGISGAVLM